MKRILVFAGFHPDDGQGSGVVCRGLLQDYPSHALHWFAASPRVIRKNRIWRPDVPVTLAKNYFPGFGMDLVYTLWKAGGHHLEASLIQKQFGQVVDQFKPDIIWVIANQRTLLYQYASLRAIETPYHVSVHDDPSIAFLLHNRIAPRNLEQIFGELYTNARTRDVISQRLAKQYQANYGVDAEVITRGIECRPSTLAAKHGVQEVLRIVLAGTLDPMHNWPDVLWDAMRMLQKKTGKRVEFHHFKTKLSGYENLHFHPSLEDSAFDRLLQSMTLGYTADPLTSVGRSFAKTSFPTKIVTYVGNSLPFVYHGPTDSTVGDFISSYKAGEIVESNRPEDLCRAFEIIIEHREKYIAECVRSSANCFDANLVRKKFLTIMAG